MIHIYTSLKEVIDATSKFVSETREADIKRTSPEEILNLFIAANRFGREAIAACYRKIYGNGYDTSARYDYVAKPVYKNHLGYHATQNSIVISWVMFVSSYAYFIEVIAHEIAHDVGHRHSHDEAFWYEYYRNCQRLGLMSSEIPYEEGIIEDKNDVRKYGYGRIKVLALPPVLSITHERRCKAMFKHKVFCRDEWSNEYAIKQEYSKLASEICALYQMNFKYLPGGHSEPIIEPWLCEPSENILSSELIKPITRNDIRLYDLEHPN